MNILGYVVQKLYPTRLTGYREKSRDSQGAYTRAWSGYSGGYLTGERTSGFYYVTGLRSYLDYLTDGQIASEELEVLPTYTDAPLTTKIRNLVLATLASIAVYALVVAAGATAITAAVSYFIHPAVDSTLCLTAGALASLVGAFFGLLFSPDPYMRCLLSYHQTCLRV